MSTRCVVPRKIRVPIRAPISVLTVLILLLTLGTASAQDSTAVTIDAVSRVGLNQPVMLGIDLASVGPDMAFGGFDLLVSWDSDALTLQYAVQGGLLDTCGWEYFSYRYDSMNCVSEPPVPGACRLVAVADMNNGNNHPWCYGEFGGRLAFLHFLTTDNESLLGQSFPVRFAWCDCGDNVFTNIAGDTLWLSANVYEDGVNITDPSLDFPSWQGAPEECLDDTAWIFRGIDYHHGSVTFHDPDTLFPGKPSITIDTVSDVGLNQPVSLDITLAETDPDMAFGGFDLLIAWDPSALILQEAVQGGLLDTCGWEYFSFQSDTLDCGPVPGSNGLCRIIALADLNNGDIHPWCYGEFPGQLATLQFLTTSSDHYLGALCPVRFYWCDCGDNAFSSIAGDTLWISDRVYEFGYDITDPYMDFPTYHGAPVQCPNDSDRVIRAIDYYSGFVEFADQDTLDLGASVSLAIDANETIFMYDTMQASIQLVQTWPTQELGGFDLLFQHQLHKLRFLGAAPGAVLQDCGWEYFMYRQGDSTICGGQPCPHSVVRIIALADLNNGDVHPNCWATDDGSLVDLQFEVLEDSSIAWSDYVYLDWIWYDCGDNSISNRDGDLLFVSDDVYDAFGFAITAESGFPTYTGAPSECIVDSGSGMVPAQRLFDFHNTRTLVAYVLEYDMRGDINYNAVAYEIADWVLFSNYFMFGLEVFEVNLEAQIAASDVNANGITLELADLVYLYRVIIGDATPISKGAWAGGDTVTIVQDTLARTISIAYDGDLSAVYLVASGEIEPSIDLPDHIVSWQYESGFTRILVVPGLQSSVPLPAIGSGLLGTYTGYGQIVAAYAAYDGMSGLTAVVEGSNNCCHQRGDVTGDPSGIIDIADLVYLVNYMFHSGPLPDCMAEADIDAQGEIADISDLVYLVSYMFQGGPQPAPCEF